MRGKKWLGAAVVALSLTVGSVVAAQPVQAQTIERCGTTIDARPVVVAVHGLDGEPDDFKKTGMNGSMNQAIESINGAKLVAPFDYHDYNLKWVTNEHLGAALAAQINCLSDASIEAGGNGKIALVDMSLGGLVLREALNQNAPVHTSASKIGLAVAIGVPNEGADIARFGGLRYRECTGSFPFVRCTTAEAVRALVPGTRELQELPPMPTTVPLRAIAVDITAGRRQFGDLVVPEWSAIAEYTTQYPGDGRFVVQCAPHRMFADNCTHPNLLKNAQVQLLVKQALGEYLLSLSEELPSGDPGDDSSPSPAPSSTEPPAPPVIA